MVNFVPGKYMRKMFCQSVTQVARLPMGAASAIFWLPVQMHYHYATDLSVSLTMSRCPKEMRKNLCDILNLVHFGSWSWSWQKFVSTCDVFNCLFPLDVQNEIQLLSGVFCYSWLVCLLGFWLRNTLLVKVGNPTSGGIVFVFHLGWCVKRVEKSEAILALVDAFQGLHPKR